MVVSLPDDYREFGLQHLQGDLALMLDVVGKVDRSHSALTEFTLDAVAAVLGLRSGG